MVTYQNVLADATDVDNLTAYRYEAARDLRLAADPPRSERHDRYASSRRQHDQVDPGEARGARKGVERGPMSP
jgi:hypothetical protein